MFSNAVLLFLVILHLLASLHAYRISSNNEPIDLLFRKYEGPTNDEERLLNFPNEQYADTNDLDNYFIFPCHPRSSHVLCNRLDHLSRRDTGFLRFGRKR